MSRPNKCIKDENGNDVWISRSNVVIPVVFKMNEETGDIFTLVEKRGSAVSHTGEWCCPCGYIDWDETIEEAAKRELFEETGLKAKSCELYLKPSYTSVGLTDETTAIVKMVVEGEISTENIEDDEDIEVFKLKIKDAKNFVKDHHVSIKGAIILMNL